MLPVVVLLHGFAFDGNIWKEQVDVLQKYFTLLIPDLPGSGRSTVDSWQLTDDSKAYSTENHTPSTIEYYADRIYALLQKENVQECIMLGHSMGGYITLAFEEKYPQMLKGFGLVHSTAFADSPEKKEMRKKGIESIGEYGAYPFIRSTTPNLFSFSYKRDHPDKIEALIEEGKHYSKEALQQYYTAMMNRPDRTNVLRGAKKPVLFIAGAEDAAVPLNDILQQMHLTTTSYIYILENIGHIGMWEDAAQVNKAILNFVRDTSAS